jgi:signal transduction histidine kinase
MPANPRSAWLVLLLVLLGATLLFLAALQYRWIGDVSAADEQRMRANVEFASSQFADELDRELARTFASFQGMPNADDLPRRYEEWASTTREVRLLHSLYVIEDGAIQRFDPQSQSFVDTSWPSELEPARHTWQPPQLASLLRDIPAFVIPMPHRPLGQPPPPLGQARPPLRQPGRPVPGELDGAPPPRGWQEGPPPRPDRPRRPPPRPSMLIIEVDRSVMTKSLVPEIARHAFGDEYDIAVADHSGALLFYSDPAWSGAHPDFERPLFTAGTPDPLRTPMPDTPTWRLLVRRHEGTPAAVVASARRRNLAVSAAILVILGFAVAMLVLLLRRAESLRRQQIEFVAGVTHELNTPLAALTSAGQNLADGVVTGNEQTARYGQLIVKEAKRLTGMVGQVLDFAGLSSSPTPRVVAPVVIKEVIDEACRFVDVPKIDVDIAGDLPEVEGDADALARAVQNLVANAVKYGDGSWVGIRAARGKHGTVAITVEDRGRGIDPRDLPHLFEPFYRGRATADRVRGSGLGLAVVRQIVLAHHGRVTIERRRSGGSAFTIHLPVSET